MGLEAGIWASRLVFGHRCWNMVSKGGGTKELLGFWAMFWVWRLILGVKARGGYEEGGGGEEISPV